MPAALRVEQSAHCFVLSGVGAGGVPFTYRVGRRAGELALRVRGELMVEEDSGLQLWRAPTDNDEFGRFADGWRAFGLHGVETAVESWWTRWQPR